METETVDIGQLAMDGAAPAQTPSTGAPGTEAPPAKAQRPRKEAAAPTDATETGRLAALEARLAELEAENRALSLERAWGARAAAEGIAHPALIEKWRPQTEEGIDGAMDDLKSFLDGFRKQQAAPPANHRPAQGSGGGTAERAPKDPTPRGRAALDGFRNACARRTA